MINLVSSLGGRVLLNEKYRVKINQTKIGNLVPGSWGGIPSNGRCQAKINQVKIEIKQNWETWYPASRAGFYLMEDAK